MKIFKLETPFGKILIRESKSAGPACMMLHGNSQSSEQFEEQFKTLGEKYRIIAWDYPGHGDSDTLNDPTLYNISTYATIGFVILKQLSVYSISLFGWSLGGHVAIEMTKIWQEKLSHPLTITGLMITGTPPCEVSEQGLQQAFTFDAEISALSNNEKWQLEEARKWVEFGGLNPDKFPNAVNSALKTDGRSRTHMIKHLLTNGYNQRKDFENLDIPVGIIVGEKDKHIKPDYMRTLQHPKFFKGGPIFMKHAGHSPFLEDPTTFNKHLDEFLIETIEKRCVDQDMMHEAVRKGNVFTVNKFLQEGVNVLAISGNKHNTALHWAVLANQRQVASNIIDFIREQKIR